MASVAKDRGPDFLFGLVRERLPKADIFFCNLESVLSLAGIRPRRLSSIEMRGFPQCTSALARAGFNLVNLANNHSMQHGEDAFVEMVSALRNENISLIGIDENGRSIPYSVNISGTRLTFVAFSLHPELYHCDRPLYSLRPDPKALVQEVIELRRSVEGYLICSLHWGSEFVQRPSPSQIELAHTLVNEGVNIILGHHPHVLQAIEIFNDGIIFYSLGNFVFDLWQRATRQSIVASIVTGQKQSFL